MKSQFLLAGVLCLAGLMACPSYASVTINGTTITFNDATVQATANPPSDHGGTVNTVNGTDSFVGGGNGNLVTDDYGTIGGGQNNWAGDNQGTASDRKWSTVGGGFLGNRASGTLSTVGGGGGYFGNTASGYYATVGGGYVNKAEGAFSFVTGMKAHDSGNANSFVWGGALGVGGNPGALRTSAGADTFNVWSAGGIYLNGVVQHASDRDMKEAYSFVSAREVLDKVVEMPVQSWRFKSEDDSIRHIGPVAQDFMASFGYGVDDKHITATDADGVALAAIQGLNAKLEEKDATVERQGQAITALRWQNAFLQARLARLEKAILKDHD